VLNGYELMIADDILRGRYRNSLENPEPVPPNEVVEYKIDLHPNDHVFLKGHRIMVQIQSTWFLLRPQPAKIRRQHLQGNGCRLREGNAKNLSFE